MIKKALALLIVSSLVISVLALAVGCGDSDIVAKVNGQGITKAELDRYVKLRFGSQSAGDPNSEQYKSLAKQMVDILVVQKIINFEAEKRGIQVTDDEISNAYEQQKQAAGGDEQLSNKLRDAGTSVEQFKEILKGDLTFQKLIAEVTKDVAEVSDAEALDYFNKHKSEEAFNKPEMRKVRHILVKDEATAKQVKAQLDAGADFAGLAKQYSTDPGSKDKGGDLGEVPSKNSGFVAEFEQAMNQLAPGQTSGPVKTQFGYHIIRVDSISPPRQVTFDEIKEDLKKGLVLEKQRQVFDKWLEETRPHYDITYSPGYEPAQPLGVPSTSPQTTATQP